MAAYAGWHAPRVAPLLFLAGIGVALLALGIVLEIGIAVAAGVGVLGCEFILSLYMQGAAANFGAALYGAALLLVAEMAHLSMELAAPLQAEAAVLRRRVQAIVGLIAGSLLVGFAAAAVSGAPFPGSMLLTTLGVGSVLAVTAIVTVLLWERQTDER